MTSMLNADTVIRSSALVNILASIHHVFAKLAGMMSHEAVMLIASNTVRSPAITQKNNSRRHPQHRRPLFRVSPRLPLQGHPPLLPRPRRAVLLALRHPGTNLYPIPPPRHSGLPRRAPDLRSWLHSSAVTLSQATSPGPQPQRLRAVRLPQHRRQQL